MPAIEPWSARVLRSILLSRPGSRTVDAFGKAAEHVSGSYLKGLTREALGIRGANPHGEGPLAKMLAELNIKAEELTLATPKQWADLARAIRKVKKEFAGLSPNESKKLTAALVHKTLGDADVLLVWSRTVKSEIGKRKYLQHRSGDLSLCPLIEKAGSHRDLSSWVEAFDAIKPCAFWLLALKSSLTPEDLAVINNELAGIQQLIEHCMPIMKGREAIEHLLQIATSTEDVRTWQRVIGQSFQRLDYSRDSLLRVLKLSLNINDFLSKVDAQILQNTTAKELAMTEMGAIWKKENEWRSIKKDGLPIFNAIDFVRFFTSKGTQNDCLLHMSAIPSHVTA